VSELRRSIARLGFACLAGATGAAAAAAGYAVFRIRQQGNRDERGPADGIVVMGARHYGARPSGVFAARLDHAAHLFAEGVAPRIIVTGGRRPGDEFTEAEVARAWLAGRGIPDADVLAETTGRTTAESLTNVAALMAQNDLRSAVIVSDRTHMLRALVIARDLGIDAYGSPTPTSPADRKPAARTRATIHELGALAHYAATGHRSSRGG
jgi:uncharacterized SAM-binding protein YcdF (DUF218 family)